ncbi:MAG: lipoyl(octanoyl) transferase LipB [Magnetococcales bacterium]|nr:lipoyl(octanoyl) transferase LipB [Magnetococcales bacterium]
MTPDVQWRRYDLLDYGAALQLQRERVAAILAGSGGEGAAAVTDQLLLLEHPSVYTIGRSGRRQDVLPPLADVPVVPVVESDRGGQVTYHGPGQLVVYVICDLRPHALTSVRRHVFRLEETVIQTLALFGVMARRHLRHPGVWVGDAKIAALGVRIDRGVAYHGFALNRAPDLNLFRGIVPCGLPHHPVTSLADLGVPVDRHTLEMQVLHALRAVFDIHTLLPPLPTEARL